MKHGPWRLTALIGLIVTASVGSLTQHALRAQANQATLLESKLNRRIAYFDASGRTLVDSVLDLTFQYDLPTALEYIDRDATTHPVTFRGRNQSVREILVALVQCAPKYRVSFSDSLVDIYVPEARQDPSNILNKRIKYFVVKKLDTHQADAELLCALGRALQPESGCGGSVARGQWGPMRLSLQMQNASVYEILNAIVAENGHAVWSTIVPPGKMSHLQAGGNWHIYPLQKPYEAAVLDKLRSISSNY